MNAIASWFCDVNKTLSIELRTAQEQHCKLFPQQVDWRRPMASNEQVDWEGKQLSQADIVCRMLSTECDLFAIATMLDHAMQLFVLSAFATRTGAELLPVGCVGMRKASQPKWCWNRYGQKM